MQSLVINKTNEVFCETVLTINHQHTFLTFVQAIAQLCLVYLAIIYLLNAFSTQLLLIDY